MLGQHRRVLRPDLGYTDQGHPRLLPRAPRLSRAERPILRLLIRRPRRSSLATYLVEHRYFSTDSIDVRIEQGYEIGAPLLLCLRAEKTEGEIGVSVGGKV
jgi:hypothetical protein